MSPRTGNGQTAEPVAADGTGSLSRAGDLFQLLRDGKARTRAELALTTGLARSTVASRIDALIASGLVGPAGEATSSGGRPPSRFAFKPAARAVLAVDVGATHVIIAVTDLGGNILSERRLVQDVAEGPETVLGRLVTEATSLLAETGRTPEDLAGIGIGLPGPVEHATGMPVKPPIMPGWDGFDVVSYVQRSFPVPVLVDNDVNIMALGERTAHWPEHANFLFIKVATGIGAGIISNGELQRGANGTAGDLGTSGCPGATTSCAGAATTAASRHSRQALPWHGHWRHRALRQRAGPTSSAWWPGATCRPSRPFARPAGTWAMCLPRW
jgi:hypothetical protein